MEKGDYVRAFLPILPETYEEGFVMRWGNRTGLSWFNSDLAFTSMFFDRQMRSAVFDDGVAFAARSYWNNGGTGTPLALLGSLSDLPETLSNAAPLVETQASFKLDFNLGDPTADEFFLDMSQMRQALDEAFSASAGEDKFGLTIECVMVSDAAKEIESNAFFDTLLEFRDETGFVFGSESFFASPGLFDTLI